MVRQKRMETILPPKIIKYRIQKKMKKMNTYNQNQTKQRETMPRTPTIPTRTFSRKKSCK
jgi:hypothetical protein